MNDLINKNKELVEQRLDRGLEIIKTRFEVQEIPIRPALNNFTLDGRTYEAFQYNIKEIGNMYYMKSTNKDDFMMDTMIFTPYFKELPVFSTDYLYMMDKRNVLHELYDLVDEEYINDTYKEYVKKFNDNLDRYDYVENKPPHNPWYEYLRSAYLAKLPTPEQDEDMMKAFDENMNIFLDMAQATPTIDTKEEYEKKWKQNKWYSDSLLERAGIATQVFLDNVGQDFTDNFFEECFFAPGTYKDKFNI